MSFQYAWITAKKEFYLLRKRKILLFSIIFFPLALGIVLAALMEVAIIYGGSGFVFQAGTYFEPILFLFVMIAALEPLITSSYSIVGEKVENTLEPLLATPSSDREILGGKYIAALLPAILSVLLGATVYIILADVFVDGLLGHLLYPNLGLALMIFLTAPLASFSMTGLSVLFSARAKSVQSAQALSRLMLVPYAVPVWLSELGLYSLNSTINLVTIAGILALTGILMYYLSLIKFSREEILTTWK